MLSHMINPDLIHEGDQVTLVLQGGEPSTWTVSVRQKTSMLVGNDQGEVKMVQIAGRRATYRIVDHQPWIT